MNGVETIPNTSRSQHEKEGYAMKRTLVLCLGLFIILVVGSRLPLTRGQLEKITFRLDTTYIPKHGSFSLPSGKVSTRTRASMWRLSPPRAPWLQARLSPRVKNNLVLQMLARWSWRGNSKPRSR